MRTLTSRLAILVSLAFLSAGVDADPATPATPVPPAVTLTSAQVTDLLALQKHLDKVSYMLFLYNWPVGVRAKFSKGMDVETDHALYLQQSEAIRGAGTQHLLNLIPNLVYYMDYRKEGPGGGPVSSGHDLVYTMADDRNKYLAMDAILNMGPDAVAPLQTLASDIKAEVTQRVRALYVLHYLNDATSQVTAKTLTAEFEKAGDAATVVRIQSAVSDNVNERWKAHIVG